MKKVKFDSEGIKKPKLNHFLAIILKEGKGSAWHWIKDSLDRFSVDGNTYFVVNKGTYLKKGVRFCVYLEGISTPLQHGNIDKEIKKVKITDAVTGAIKEHTLTLIKGLKFDSKLIDMLLNRHLADEFTKNRMDTPNIVIVVLVLLTLITSIINIAMWFK